VAAVRDHDGQQLAYVALSAIAKNNGNVTASRARAALSAMFRWAIGEGLCDHNPVTGTNRQDEKGHDRATTFFDVATACLRRHVRYGISFKEIS
jgi:hypothetical protein